jgi:hypothetical protein
MTENQNIKSTVDAIVFGYQNGKLYVLLLIQQKIWEAKHPVGFAWIGSQ